MFSMCSELTPRAPIPDTRIPQLMQPCSLTPVVETWLMWLWLMRMATHYSVVFSILARHVCELQRFEAEVYSTFASWILVKNQLLRWKHSTLRSVVPLFMFVCSTWLSKVSSKWKTAVSNTISCFFNFASNLFSIWPELMNSIFAISFTYFKFIE